MQHHRPQLGIWLATALVVLIGHGLPGRVWAAPAGTPEAAPAATPEGASPTTINGPVGPITVPVPQVKTTTINGPVGPITVPVSPAATGSGNLKAPRTAPAVSAPVQHLTPLPAPSLDCHLNYAGSDCNDALGFLAAVVKIILGLGATAFMFMFLWGGILYMTGGAAFTEGKGKDEHTINLARKTIVNAVLGLIVILSAYAVLKFLLGELIL